jgi:hypothetical protein
MKGLYLKKIIWYMEYYSLKELLNLFELEKEEYWIL